MSVLVLGEAEVGEHLAMGECIDAMERALGELARGESHMPLRLAMRGPGASGLLGLMPAYRGGEVPVYSLKAVGVFPENPRIGLDAHQGIVTLFDGENGLPTAILNASAMTSIRTAAVTALATRLLAREDAGVLAMLGSGVQAQAHLRALALVRPFAQVRVFSPNAEHARRAGRGGELGARRGRALSWSRPARARRSRERTWSSPRPTRERRCSSGPGSPTASTSTRSARASRRRASWTWRRSPRRSCSSTAASRPRTRPVTSAWRCSEGAIGEDHIRAELGEVVIGSHPGRSGPAAITVFRSLGLAVEDLAAAEVAVASARRAGAGT